MRDWFQGMETEFGWTPPSKKEAISSLHPSLMEVMTGAEEVEGEEITWKPPTSASPMKTDFQHSAPRAPLTGEEEEADSRWQVVMKMMTKNCESVVVFYVVCGIKKKSMLSSGINSCGLCLTVPQGDHSGRHGDMGEFRPVGLLVLLSLQDMFIWFVSNTFNHTISVVICSRGTSCEWWIYYTNHQDGRLEHVCHFLPSGFTDHSPEEVRLEYCSSRASGDLQGYVSVVSFLILVFRTIRKLSVYYEFENNWLFFPLHGCEHSF